MCTWIWTEFLNRAQNNNHKVKEFKELGSNPQLENLYKKKTSYENQDQRFSSKGRTSQH
jgi:hypothetical protein